MKLFLKGFIIGIAKVIPGVSGAMIAVSFGIYDKLINSITCFFDDKKNNFKFLLLVGSGILLSIVLFSKIIRYLIGNYYLIMMMLFIGLISGGTISFSKNIKFNSKNIIIILLVIFLVMIISLGNSSNNYMINGTYLDCVIFFIGGVIEIISSIVPGISGTALLMLFGIYDNVLVLFSNIFDFNFVINNIMIYISYGVGMVLTFIIFSILISYLLKKYRKLFDTIVFGLSISSILFLIMIAFNNSYNIIQYVFGIFFFFVGVLISYIFDK